MKKPCLFTSLHKPSQIAATALTVSLFSFALFVKAQSTKPYKAPQDTVVIKRNPAESLTTYQVVKNTANVDSRMTGAAVKAAEILLDTIRYNAKTGVPLARLFSNDDLEYISRQGVTGVVALFELINKYLPKGHSITFRTDEIEEQTLAENPLVLKNLRAIISAKPASFQSNLPQWKENVYQAYIARDYGTKLHNTITITSATREMRETPGLQILNGDGSSITLNEILKQAQLKTNNKYAAEKLAVAEFRGLTFPGEKISRENANENYKRALLELIRLQEGDMIRHPETKKFIEELTNDLKKGSKSNVLNALKNSMFFDANVPGNLGPVLLTETQVISEDQMSRDAGSKSLELLMLTALHYGERDAVKLLKRLRNGTAALPAKQTGDFTPKRLGQLTDHGTEKLKSLGFGTNKTEAMTSADLVLVAVAGPETPVVVKTNAFINLQKVGLSIVNHYYLEEIKETKNTILINPRIKIGSRHIEYRASFDAVNFVPELIDGLFLNQKGSRVVQNGAEIRVESDLYFSNAEKIAEKGVKPVLFPEFGILAGAGRRSVGYDDNTIPGPHGAVPKFKQSYINWGGHVGLNAGPFLLAMDATILSTPEDSDPYRRFFDLSAAMTYYRYSLMAHVLNVGLGKTEQGKGSNLTLDAEFAGETNNEATFNHAVTQSGTSQTGSGEWQRDFDRANPNGQYNQQIATDMILNGDVKAAYAASNFAALHAGIQKANFHFKGSLGLYNLYAINGYRENNSEWSRLLFRNTIKGNLFGALSLTYNFSSRTNAEKHRRTESYQINGNGERTPGKVEESFSSKRTSFGPRDHAIFIIR